MNYSTKTPSAPGWYWMRQSDGKDVVVQVARIRYELFDVAAEIDRQPGGLG